MHSLLLGGYVGSLFLNGGHHVYRTPTMCWLGTCPTASGKDTWCLQSNGREKDMNQKITQAKQRPLVLGEHTKEKRGQIGSEKAYQRKWKQWTLKAAVLQIRFKTSNIYTTLVLLKYRLLGVTPELLDQKLGARPSNLCSKGMLMLSLCSKVCVKSEKTKRGRGESSRKDKFVQRLHGVQRPQKQLDKCH